MSLLRYCFGVVVYLFVGACFVLVVTVLCCFVVVIDLIMWITSWFWLLCFDCLCLRFALIWRYCVVGGYCSLLAGWMFNSVVTLIVSCYWVYFVLVIICLWLLGVSVCGYLICLCLLALLYDVCLLLVWLLRLALSVCLFLIWRLCEWCWYCFLRFVFLLLCSIYCCWIDDVWFLLYWLLVLLVICFAFVRLDGRCV